MQSLLCFFCFSIFLIFLDKLLAVSSFVAALYNLVFAPSAPSQPVRTTEPPVDAGEARTAASPIPGTSLTPRCSMYCVLFVLLSLRGILTHCFDCLISALPLNSRTDRDDDFPSAEEELEVDQVSRLLDEQDENFNDICRKIDRLKPLLRQLKQTQPQPQPQPQAHTLTHQDKWHHAATYTISLNNNHDCERPVSDFEILLDESQQNINQVCEIISRLQPLYEAQQKEQEHRSRRPSSFYKTLAVACAFAFGITVGVGALASCRHTPSVDPTTHMIPVNLNMQPRRDVTNLEPSSFIPRPVKVQDLLCGQDRLLLPAPSFGNVTFTPHLELVIIPFRSSIDLTTDKEMILRGDTSLSVWASPQRSLQPSVFLSQLQIHPSAFDQGHALKTALQIRSGTELDLLLCYYRRDSGGANFILVLCAALILFVMLKRPEDCRDRGPCAWPEDDSDLDCNEPGIEGTESIEWSGAVERCKSTNWNGDAIKLHRSIDWSDAMVLLFDGDSEDHIRAFPDFGPAFQALFHEQEQRRPRRRRRQQQQRKTANVHRRRQSKPSRTTDSEDWAFSFEVLFEEPLLRRSTRLMGKPRVDYRGM